ncbi:MAG: secretin N-terminal domain-containing protein, partial [Fidelibacterota bacterium]
MKMKDRNKTFLFIFFLIFMGGPVHPSDRDGDTSGTLTMSLRGVTVNKVLKILGEKTGKNFIADPSIENRKINVELKDVPIDEAMAVIMETNGLGYRRKEGTNIYIVDSIERIMMQTVITSVKLQYAEAEKLKTIIESIVTPGIGSAIADARTNILIIRDNPGRIEELKVLIKQMDRPTYQVYIKAAIVEISTS